MNSCSYQDCQSIRPPIANILGFALENAEGPITEDGSRDRSELAGFNQDAEKSRLSTEDRDDLEGRFIRGQKPVSAPSKDEWDSHMRTHIPYRRWCPFCVKGKCKSGVHQKSSKSPEDIEREVPVISFDYMNPKSEDGKDRGIDSLPILVSIDRRTKYHSAAMVPNK